MKGLIDLSLKTPFFEGMHQNSKWTSHLNSEQKEAALHNFGPLLILAGAGSGKTTVLVSRTGRLIDEKIVEPEQVLVLTFTNKAARELKARVATKIGDKGSKIWAGTFHSFGMQLLRENHQAAGLPKRFAVADATDARSLVKDILKDIVHGEKEAFDPDRLLAIISTLREGRKPAPTYHPSDVEMAEILLPKYLNQLKMWGAVDFDGLLLEPLKLFKKYPDVLKQYQDRFQQVMVDEFQDTNRVQMKLVQALVEKHKNIVVVGDDDQSIYGWRGAVLSNILNFPKTFKNCTVVRLETNYRSTSQILDVANSVIVKNKARHSKMLKPHRFDEDSHRPEVFTYETDDDEIEEVISQIHHFQNKGFSLDQIAVLFRSNSQGGLLEGILRKHGIEYSLSGGAGFFDRKEVRDIFSYIRSAITPNDLSLRRILNTPTRGIGRQTFQLLDEWMKDHDGSFYKALKNANEIGVSGAASHSIGEFFQILGRLKEFLTSKDPIEYARQLPEFFSEIGYKAYVYGSYKDAASAHKKWQLVEILGRILDGFVARSGRGAKTIQEFIDSMELRDSPEDDKEEGQKLQLLTLHACKGLEFSVVIMIGLEEGLLPHETLGLDIDEERRLFYVGVTRAQKYLILTHSKKRKRYGKWRLSTPSRFLVEVPEKLLEKYENGSRPLGDQGRRHLLDQLYAKLDRRISE